MPIYFLVDSITGRQVKVDVGTASCSCSDFKRNCLLYDSGDPRRMCKHLEEALAIEGMIRTPPDAQGLAGIPKRRRGTTSLHSQSSLA